MTTTGYIYQIIPIQGSKALSYIGSTKTPIKHRLQRHQHSYEEYKNGIGIIVSVYDLFDDFGVNNCEVIELEEIEYQDRDDLRKLEQFYIDNLPCVNIQRAYRTDEEKLEQHREANIKYYAKNRDEINEKGRIYYQEHIEEEKERGRLYYNNNKELINGKQKIYREKTKEHRQEYRSVKIECECGTEVCRGDISTHRKSIKHQKLMDLK